MQHGRFVVISMLIAATSACADNAAVTAPNVEAVDGPQLISNGQPTGSAYGGVGVLLIDEGADRRIDGLCSGSLISPTVFLTAAHCISGPGTDYYISFATDILPLPPASQLIKSSTAFKAPNTDVAVVILPAGSTTGIPVYDLPSLGLFEALKKGGVLARETAIVVGYGSSSLHRGPLESGLDGVRKFAETKVLSIKGQFLEIADAHGQSDQGGTCGGDSGGPVFLKSNPDVVVAITTAGFPDGCHAIGIYTRIDTEAALSFLAGFVAP